MYTNNVIQLFLPTTEIPTCQDPGPIQQGTRLPEEAPLEGGLFRVGDTILYACSHVDDTLVGPSSIECLLDTSTGEGRWTDDQPECKAPPPILCPLPSNGELEHGHIKVIDEGTILYRCDHSYYLNLELTVETEYMRTCQEDGTWSGHHQECVCKFNTGLLYLLIFLQPTLLFPNQQVVQMSNRPSQMLDLHDS